MLSHWRLADLSAGRSFLIGGETNRNYPSDAAAHWEKSLCPGLER